MKDDIQINGELMTDRINNLDRIDELIELFSHKFNKRIDILNLGNLRSKGIDQEKLIILLEEICNTGDSILVGYDKLKKQGRI